MPTHYTEGQRLQGSDGKVYVVHGGVPVEESSVSAGNPFDQFDEPARPQVFGRPKPGLQYEGPKAQADLLKIQLENEALRQKIAQDDGGGADALDPATISYYAQQVLSGAPMPAIGMGKQAAQSRQAIMKEVARLGGAAGMTGADAARQLAHYKAGTKQIANLENMAGTIGANEQTALMNGQQFLDRSAELPGQTQIAPLNAISDWIQRRFGGTTISAMDAAHNTFVNEYAKVVAGSPSGAGTLSDSARREAMDTIQSDASLEQKQRAFAQMKTDMANRMAAIHSGINEAYKGLTEHPGYAVPEGTQALPLAGAAGANNRAGGVAGVGSPGGGAPPPYTPFGLGGPGGGEPGGGGTGGQAIATDQYRDVYNAQISRMTDRLIRQGKSAAEINAAIGGANGRSVTQKQVDAAYKYITVTNPGYKGLLADDSDKVPTTRFQRASASAPSVRWPLK